MDYDAIVIGSGQAGVPLATRLARSGRSVLLAERGDLGGSDQRTIEIAGERHRAMALVLNVGARPIDPPIPGLPGVPMARQQACDRLSPPRCHGTSPEHRTEAGELIHVFAALLQAGATARAIVDMEVCTRCWLQRRANRTRTQRTPAHYFRDPDGPYRSIAHASFTLVRPQNQRRARGCEKQGGGEIPPPA